MELKTQREKLFYLSAEYQQDLVSAINPEMIVELENAIKYLNECRNKNNNIGGIDSQDA